MALHYSQQTQEYHNSQQGLAAAPQGSYPPKDPSYGQPFAGKIQQGYPASYDEQRLPQSQFPGGSSYAAPQSYQMNSQYPPQQPYAPAPVGENASYYNTAPVDQYGNPIGPGIPEEEKGLGSTVVGGAAGGYAGHKLGGGFIGSAAGAVLGAIGMNVATHEIKDHTGNGKNKHKKHHKKHGCEARRERRRARRARRWGYGWSSSSSDSD